MKSSGFILVFSMIMMSACMMVITFFSTKVLFFSAFDSLFLERQQAHQAAMSGVDIAMSLLVPPFEQKKNTAAPTRIDMQKHILSTIMPLLQRWQPFLLTQQKDGIDADIRICMSAEEGKVNLTKLYDYKKKSIINDKQLLFTTISCIVKPQDTLSASQRLAKFLAEHTLYEITQLIDILVSTMPLFYYPPSENTQCTLAVSDLLSLWNDQPKVNPWVLSASMVISLGGRVVFNDSYFTNRKQAAKLLEENTSSTSFKERWNAIGKKMYGIEFDALPKNSSDFFDEGIRIKHFSVLSCAKVGRTTAYVLAIIVQKSAEEFVIKKIYRL